MSMADRDGFILVRRQARALAFQRPPTCSPIRCTTDSRFSRACVPYKTVDGTAIFRLADHTERPVSTRPTST